MRGQPQTLVRDENAYIGDLGQLERYIQTELGTWPLACSCRYQSNRYYEYEQLSHNSITTYTCTVGRYLMSLVINIHMPLV